LVRSYLGRGEDEGISRVRYVHGDAKARGQGPR
jgi:hypothetical protein